MTVTPQKSRVKLGETGEFTCIASGSPLPKLTWRKLNASVPIYATVSDGVLRIPNVTHQDAGIYFCDASNVEGSAQGNTTLEIKGITRKQVMVFSSFYLFVFVLNKVDVESI